MQFDAIASGAAPEGRVLIIPVDLGSLLPDTDLNARSPEAGSMNTPHVLAVVLTTFRVRSRGLSITLIPQVAAGAALGRFREHRRRAA